MVEKNEHIFLDEEPEDKDDLSARLLSEQRPHNQWPDKEETNRHLSSLCKESRLTGMRINTNESSKGFQSSRLSSRSSSTEFKLSEAQEHGQPLQYKEIVQQGYSDRPSRPPASKKDPNSNELPSLTSKEPLFEGRVPRQRAGCCSRIFFTWVSPLIGFTKQHGKIEMRHLGSLEETSRINVLIQKLDSCWQAQMKNPGPNMLRNALFNSNFGDLAWLFLLKLVEVSLKLLYPFIIGILVEFVETGENKYYE